jgi:hypothetical protein
LIARVAFAVLLLLAGVAWIEPTGAYKVLSGNRAVTASIVTEGNGYSAPIVSACRSGITGTTCFIKIYNNATTAQTYTVTRQADANSVVTSWSIDGHAAVSNVGTGNSVAIGGTSLATLTIKSCTVGCTTRTTTWMIQGANGGILTSREENLVLTVTNV